MSRWDNQSQPPPAILPLNQFGESGYPDASRDSIAVGGIDGALYVKVMTNEQLEVLRTQIAAYTTIIEQLVELHKILLWDGTITVDLAIDKKEVSNCDGAGSLTCTTCQGSGIQPRYLDRRNSKMMTKDGRGCHSYKFDNACSRA